MYEKKANGLRTAPLTTMTNTSRVRFILINLGEQSWEWVTIKNRTGQTTSLKISEAVVKSVVFSTAYFMSI